MNKKNQLSKFIAVTQRELYISDINEKRDSLDRRWLDFFEKCNLVPILVPNNIKLLQKLTNHICFNGVILSGGGDLVSLGGNDYEREQVEEYLIEICLKNNIPLLGVCRGMQKIQDYFDIKLNKINGHVSPDQYILIKDKKEKVNSFHNFGSDSTHPDFSTWALSYDGIVKAISHKKYDIHGIMWHPERLSPFRQQDINFFKKVFIEQ